jgi:hypothetical protein
MVQGLAASVADCETGDLERAGKNYAKRSIACARPLTSPAAVSADCQHGRARLCSRPNRFAVAEMGTFAIYTLWLLWSAQ